MTETLGILIPFLIADVLLISDVLNPVLFAFMVYAVGTPRPVLTSSVMLLGHKRDQGSRDQGQVLPFARC
jgi:hypothetical protein